MKSITTLLLLLVTLCMPAISQELLWLKRYGGAESEVGNDLIEMDDGGFLAVGSSITYKANPAAEVSGYLVRTDNAGSVIWEKSVGSYRNVILMAVHPLPGGNFRLVGRTRISDWNYRIYIAEIDAEADIVWEKLAGDSATGFYPNGVRPTRDGGFVAAGNIGSRTGIARFSVDGTLLWERSYDVGGDLGHAAHVRELADGSFALVGSGIGSGGGIEGPMMDMMLMKISAQGNSLWTRLLGTDESENGYDVIEQSDGDLLVIGIMLQNINAVEGKLYMVRVDSSGVFQTSSLSGNGIGSYNRIESIERTREGGFMMVGRAGSDDYGLYLLKTDEEGVKQWDIKAGPTGRRYSGRSAVQLRDGSFAAVGNGDSDLVMVGIAERPSAVTGELRLPTVLRFW